MYTNDIICAISTPPGIGAIAIVRLSGEGCIGLVDSIFNAASKQPLTAQKANTVHFGYIADGDILLDEVLVTVFRSPHSFTGEDSVEIACHGSVYIQQQILKLAVDRGARPAAPGEFTQRAFLNGKMDLSQAEAVADLIASSSAAAHRMALTQMRGGFSIELKRLRKELLHITTLLELELDFSEEDVEFADRTELNRIASNIEHLLAKLCNSFSLGNVLKNGVPVAIVGNTNVGKSTLLNTLLREERAIVSDIAGTTRDVIEDVVNLEGITFRFIDTAGIRATDDQVEHMGIERTFTKIAQAHIVLMLTDLKRGTEQFTEYYQQVKEHLAPHAKLMIVLNKIDEVEDVLTPQETIRLLTSGEEIIPISASTSKNIEGLVQKLVSAVQINSLCDSDIIVSNIRHYEALKHALTAIHHVQNSLISGVSSEFVSQDIRECLHYLGEITGEISNEEVLGNVFGNFCIGK